MASRPAPATMTLVHPALVLAMIIHPNHFIEDASMSRYWSSHIHSLTPYVPGEQPKLDNLVKLNTNENPYGPSPRVIEAIQQALDDSLRLYPDPNSDQLRQTIANYYELTP